MFVFNNSIRINFTPQIFIENSKYIGLLTDDLMTQLDEDSDVYVPKRKRRSGSLNRECHFLLFYSMYQSALFHY